MEWDISIGRIVFLQEEQVSVGIPAHPWMSRYIRIHPWIGFIGAWCILGEACLASVSMAHHVDWLAEKSFKGLMWTGGGVVLNLLVSGTVEKICTCLGVCEREIQQLFTRTLLATCCCITWCHEE